MESEFDIAIVGMAGRFPGAGNLEEFWRNLVGGVESITAFTKEELLAEGVPAALLSRPDYVTASPVLEAPDLFDATFFGFTPREASTMDPQHRLILELAHAALEDAGCDPDRFSGRIGVFTGSAMNTYFTRSGLNERLTEDYIPTLIHNDKDFLSTRISYKLGLQGPSLTVQTACSTSLVAIHLARQSLLSEESDLALAGAISVKVPHRSGYLYDGGGIVSPDAHVRPFDAGANGTVFGSGGGIIVMKRLLDAIAQGDTIHAVIKGSAVNNDGTRKAGYTAPSVNGQADAVVEALANAGLNAEDITYVEAHGSGTPVGDPIEVMALTKAFRSFTSRSSYCALGSVKSNIGHLDVAAGMAGLIKTVLALKNRRLPPTLHFAKSNPEINFATTPFYVNGNTLEWDGAGKLRRAGVMSTGMGGTNVHVILEEAPVAPPQTNSSSLQVLLLSAKTPSALEVMSTNLAKFLVADHPFSDVAYTLQNGRRRFCCRRFVVCRNKEEAATALISSGTKQNSSVLNHNKPIRPIIFLLPGIGDHYVGMGQGLYDKFEVFHKEIDRCAEILHPLLNCDIRGILFSDKSVPPKSAQEPGIDLKRMLGHYSGETSDPASRRLNQTINVQPALFSLEYALARLWMYLGIQPHRIVGHSMGEYVAACLAGVFSLEDALKLIAIRAKLVSQLPSGFMLAVALSEEKLLPLLDGNISIALINGPNLCIVAGPLAALADFQARLTEQEIIFRPVRNSHAFHSRMLDPITEAFSKEVKKVRLHAPRISFISNVSGTWIKPEQAVDPAYWVEHARRTARFSDALEQLWKIPDCLPLEVGPGRTLGVLATQHPGRAACPESLVLSSLRHEYETQADPEFLLHNIGRLWLAGVEIEWDKLHPQINRRKISLPTYPFERQRYWVEPPTAHEGAATNQDPLKLLYPSKDISDWFYLPSWERIAITPNRMADANPETLWLVMGERSHIMDRLVAALEQSGASVAPVLFGKCYTHRKDGECQIRPAVLDDYANLLRHFKITSKKSLHIVHLGALSSRIKMPDAGYDELSQNLGFYSLLNLAKAIGELEELVPVFLGVVSSRIHEVTGEEELNPAVATILGPCGVVPKEFPNITSFAVDLPAVPTDRKSLDEIAHRLLHEFRDPVKGQIIAYRGAYRWKKVFKPKQLPPLTPLTGEAGIRAQGLRPRGVYLITGGTGGIGLAIAKHLAQACHARLLLTRKSAFPKKTEWRQRLATGDLSDADQRIVSELLEIEVLGGEVDVITCEVTDRVGMKDLIKQTLSKHGAIHGVIHAAGIVQDGMIQFKTMEVADSVMAPKVKGACILHDLLKNLDLDALILFSSISTVAPLHGQSDYCAANAFLDGFANYFTSKTGIHTLVINWPGWREVGILTKLKTLAGQEDSAEKRLKHAILTKDGVEVFKRALASKFAQLVVCPMDLSAAIAESNVPLLKSGIQNAVLFPAVVPHNFPNTNKSNDFVERELAGIWSAVLGITSIDRQQNFFELGGHSLLAMQVVARIRTVLQVSFSLRYFFANPTIEGMAKRISDLRSAGKEPSGKEPGSARLPVNEGLVEHALSEYTKERKPELIQLHEGNSGSELFFLVDEGSLGLLKLAHLLQGESSVFASLVPFPESALRAAVNKQFSALPSMEDLAAYHVSLILSRPANGPLLLAGRCFGGNLAFEVAHQLHRAGRKVEAILMLDTWMEKPDFWWSKKNWLKAHVGKLLKQGSPYLFGKSLHKINFEKDQVAWRLKLAMNGDFNVHVPWYVIERIFTHALEGYRPRLLESRSVLFVSEDDWLATAYLKIDNSLGVARWMRGGVKTIVVPGDHVNVLDEPRLPKLAEFFKNGLEKLRSRPVESQETFSAT